jgi:D-alanine-D-alanine ligase
MTNKWKGKKVAVLMGGVTKERDISLRTGNAISQALRRRGYAVVDIDVGSDIVAMIEKEKPDVAFIALHGKFGEDGCIQGMLEMMRIPYTGGGVLGSSVGMDKVVCSMVAKYLGIPVPREQAFNAKEMSSKQFIEQLKIPYPVIVKPSREGSTINISIVMKSEELPGAIEAALDSDDKVIIQEYLKGKEVTVGLLNGRALPVLEIAPKSGFYDYKSKYTKGMTEYIVPARISAGCAEKIQRWSVDIFMALDCSGAARCDYIVDEKNAAWFLEINTIPGMTELSLVPKAAAHIGIDFDTLAEEILNSASLKVNV